MHELYELKSKAEYISDLVRAMLAGNIREEMPQHLIDECYRKLCDVSEALDEYHDFGLEDD